MLGNAGPIVIFDRHSCPSNTRERRSHLDDAAIQFTIDTKEKMSSKPSRISASVLEIAPSASGSGSRIQKQMSSNETIEIIKKEYRTAHAKAHEERSASQKAAGEVENGMLGRISGFSDTIIYDRSATVPGFSSFYKGLFIRLFPISIELPVNCFTLKILLDVLDAGTYATQDVTFSHEHVSVVTRRLEGQQSFSWTAICLIITVSKWYKPRTVFDLVSCESVLKWRERVHQIQCSPVRVKRHPSHAVQACTFARALSAYVFRAGPRPTVKSPFQKRFGTMLEGISFGSTPTKTSLKNLLAPLSRGPKVKEGLLLIYRADHSLRAVICEDKCLTEGREDSDEHVYLGMVLGKALSSLSLCRHLGHHSCYSFKGEEVIGFEKNGLRLVCPTSESQFSTPVHGFFI